MPTTGHPVPRPTQPDLVEVDDVTLRVRTLPGTGAGTASGAGRDLVLVHGLGASSASFERLARRLTALGTVHLLDLPGFGGTPRPARDLSVGHHARAVARWLERTGVRSAVLVGHSMGAQVAAEVAVQAPARTSHVVLVGPTVDAEARTAVRHALRLVRSGVHERPRTLGLLARGYVRCGPSWYASTLQAMLGHRLEERLPTVTVPVLVVRGEHDRVAPARWAHLLAGVAPRGHAVTVAGGGHAAMDGADVAVARLVGDLVGR